MCNATNPEEVSIAITLWACILVVPTSKLVSVNSCPDVACAFRYTSRHMEGYISINRRPHSPIHCFCGEEPHSRSYGRTAALRPIVQPL